MLSLLFVLLGFASSFGKTYDNNEYWSAVCNPDSSSCSLVKKSELNDVDKSYSHAYGMYRDDINEVGWGKIWIHGDETSEGWYQAGFVEGSLTSLRVYQHFKSWYSYQFSTPPSDATVEFILNQYDYAVQLSAQYPEDPYYVRLGQILSQFEGILAGVNYAAEEGQTLSKLDLLLLEASGDLYEIIPATTPSEFKLHIGKLSAESFHDEWHRTVSCSALIKMKEDRSDVFAGHATWTSYVNMLRIYKNYNIGGDTQPYQSSHSSKPGMIYSKDDFYVLPNDNQKLVVMETTNGVMNQELLNLVTPHSLLTWQRIPLANSVSNGGADWTSVFAKHNSGTYANQWMVLDMKLFTPNKGPAEENFLWIIEVAPGIAARKDVSSTFIGNGDYWPSYNCPYQKDVYVATGFLKAYETYGDKYSYTNCSRAQMFARDQGSIHTYEDFQAEIRYNEWQTDPLSENDPYNSISSRKDLRNPTTQPTQAATSGGIDAKVTSWQHMMGSNTGLSHAESGPTHVSQPVFQWSGSPWEDEVHLGQPDVFNFNFTEMDFYAH